MARSTSTGRGERDDSYAEATQEQRSSWLRSLRFSGFSLLVLAVVVFGVLILTPNVSQFVSQRQEIARLNADNTASKAEIDRLKAERERWNDKTYVTAQARDRLYFVKPGEVSFIVINDVDSGALTDYQAPVSDEVEQAKVDWPAALLGSVLSAGGANVARDTATDPGE